jgi:hypothetical protein
MDEGDHVGQVFDSGVVSIVPWASHRVDLLGELLGSPLEPAPEASHRSHMV